jgi:hypothetical protein
VIPSAALVSLLRGALGPLHSAVISFRSRPIRKYRPERHYMRGPGPKWREKHVLKNLSVRGKRSDTPMSVG